MTGTTRVLIPLDGSEASAQVVPVVERLLLRQDVEAVLLAVHRVPPSKPSASWEEDLGALRDHLQQVEDRLRDAGAAVSHNVAAGDAASQILNAVSVFQPTLVVMSTHGRGGLRRFVRGSVAERVLRQCPVPLLLVNPQTSGEAAPIRGFDRVLAPLDGSERSAAILPLVAELAGLYQSEVLLLRVENFQALGAGGKLRSVEEVEATLAPAREQLVAEGVPAERVELKAVIGHEVDAILDAAEDVDLVAMTTHGRTGLAHWWFGSVAETVLRHCPVPLLVLRVSGPDVPLAEEAKLLEKDEV